VVRAVIASAHHQASRDVIPRVDIRVVRMPAFMERVSAIRVSVLGHCFQRRLSLTLESHESGHHEHAIATLALSRRNGELQFRLLDYSGS
jgi:hypothetical protein